jgi:hypothetical protein
MLFDRIATYLVATSFLTLAYVASLNLHSKFSLVISGFGVVVGIVIGMDMIPNSRRLADLTIRYHQEAQLGKKPGGTWFTAFTAFAATFTVISILLWIGLSLGALFFHII